MINIIKHKLGLDFDPHNEKLAVIGLAFFLIWSIAFGDHAFSSLGLEDYWLKSVQEVSVILMLLLTIDDH